jgi:hypothetical protein
MSRYAGDSLVLTDSIAVSPEVFSGSKYVPILKFAITVELRIIYIF